MKLKKLLLSLCITSLVLISSCGISFNNTVKVNVKNNATIHLEEYAIMLDLEQIQQKLPDLTKNNLQLMQNKETLPYQVFHKNGKVMILTLVNAKPGETISIDASVTSEPGKFKKRTHAELSVKTGGIFEDKKYVGGDGKFMPIDSLRVPDECTDHSYYIKYEGPGWESDKVAYRLYLDWRNAIDIFGKNTTDVTLPVVGADGYDSYHNLNDWGMDILQVGNSLGMASVGTWSDGKAIRVEKTDSVICKIETDGDLYSSFVTSYYNWNSANGAIDLDVTTSIMAGSRMTKQLLKFKGDIENMATGIVKADSIPLIKGPADTQWGYIATWGKQSLNNDNLGMAVFFKNEDVLQVTEDELSHVVVLKPTENKVKYYFAAFWEKENGEQFSERDFNKYLEESILLLEKPVEISY